MQAKSQIQHNREEVGVSFITYAVEEAYDHMNGTNVVLVAKIHGIGTSKVSP